MRSRIEKISSLLKQEIGGVLLRELDISKDIMITAKDVEVSLDLRYAKIKVSIIPFSKVEKTLEILNSQSNVIWRALAKKISLKVVPQIKFELDSSEEKIANIERLLKK